MASPLRPTPPASGEGSHRRRLVTTSLLVLLLLSLTSRTVVVVGDVVTSSNKITELTNSERAMLDVVKAYLSKQYDDLKVLSQFLWERSRQIQLASQDDDLQLHAQHPNGAYLLIKNFVTRWSGMVEMHPSLKGDLNALFLPGDADHRESYKSLIRLQRVYRLTARHMFRGNYSGFLGPALLTEDAFSLGRHAFTSGYLNESAEWLEVTVDVLRSAVRDEAKSAQTPPSANGVWLSRAAALLGRCYVFQNRTQEARSLYDVSILYEPGGGDVIQLKKELDSTAEPVTYRHNHHPKDHNMSKLCSRDKEHRVTEIRPWHVCRYKAALACPYLRFKEEILSISPFASVFYDVAVDHEVEAIKNFVKANLYRGSIGFNENAQTSDVRTSDLSWIRDDQFPVAARVSRRVKVITGLDTNSTVHPDGSFSAEPMQVVNYGLGGHYGAHTDYVEGKNGSRIATFLIYLTDVEKGGSTVFLQSGISVAPIKGMALFWYNYTPALKQDNMTEHAGCPVVIGQKWIANKWIWVHGNTWRRPCGPVPNSTQIDVERMLTSRMTSDLLHHTT